MTQQLLALGAIAVACGGCAPDVRAPVAAPPQASPPPPAAEPVFDPPQPALRLPTHFLPTRYAARLAVDPAQSTFTGEIAITGTLDRRSAVIWLHGKQLHVQRATATHDGASVDLAVTLRGADLLELRPAAPLAAGTYVVTLTYDGGVQPVGGYAGLFVFLYGGERYLTSQLEATAGRLVFPCFDEPSVKTPWQLTLDVPKGQTAVSNTAVAREVGLDATHVRVEFAPTRPLPSYLVAFGVGPYDVVDAGHSATGTPLRLIVPHGEAKRTAYAAAMLPKIVDVLAAWTDIPFPYPKLDLLVMDAPVAMENAGLITVPPWTLMHDTAVPSALTREDFVDLVGHETAHEWFGDLVTTAWWDDTWLNESFATFMENKVQQALEPAWHDADYHVTRRTGAMNADAAVSARQIRQPITSDGDVQNSFDTLSYTKGATVLAMFEASIGEEVFQRGLRAYLRAHADGTATFADLVSALETAAGKPLAPAFATFLDQPGVPELDLAVTCTPGSPARASIAQHRYVPTGGLAAATAQRWTFPLCVAFETADHARGETCGLLEQATLELALPASACPAWVLPDAGAHAYARIALTEPQVVALRDHGWAKLTWPERRAVFEAARSRAGDGKLSIAAFMSLAPKLLAGSRFEVSDAVADGRGLAGGFQDWLAGSELAAARARMRALIAPLVKKLGLAPRAGESIDDESNRLVAARTGEWAGEPAIARAAVAQVAHYRELPPRLRATVLAIAVSASPEVAKQIRAAALAETDVAVRSDLFGSLGAIRDPERLRAMLDTILEPGVHGLDAIGVLTGWSDQLQRAVVERWVRTHFADLQRVIPSDGSEIFPMLQWTAGTFTAACDAARRDELAAYVTKTYGVLPAGERPTKQAIEGMDQCIARRALVEPSLRAWLLK